MSALRQLQKGVSKSVLTSKRFIQDASGKVKDTTLDVLKDAKEGIREGLKDEKSNEMKLKRTDSGKFHESDDDDPDIRFSVAPGAKLDDDFHMAPYSVRPGAGIGMGAESGPIKEAHSDDDMYTEEHGEMGLNDDDDDSTAGVTKKKKKKARKIKYRKSGDDSDGSDASTKSNRSTKSSKSSKSSKSRKKKLKKDRSTRSDLSTGSRRTKSDKSPSRQKSMSSVASEKSDRKKKKKKKVESSDDEDERHDQVSPLPMSPNGKKDPVLPTRSRSPIRSPSKRNKNLGASVASSISPSDSPSGGSGSGVQPRTHPVKQELQRFSDLWRSQGGDDDDTAVSRESIPVGQLSVLLGELNAEIKEDGDDVTNDVLEAKIRSLEQKLHDSEDKVEKLIVEKSDISKELNEEQLRNDEVSRRLLYLEDRVEELEAEKKELESQPKAGEQQADPIEVFELQQELNTMKTEMAIQGDRHSQALHTKDERIAELEAKLQAAEEARDAGGGGGDGSLAQPRESLATSMRSTVSTASTDAKTQGLLLRSNDKIQKQESEIKELKQRLEELGNVDVIEAKDAEIKNLGIQMFELECKMKDMEAEHEKSLKQKEETIEFFQSQVVEMQKKMPKPAAYTRQGSRDGDEGTMALGGDGGDNGDFGEGSGFFGAIARASPGWLGGRQTVDRRRARDGPMAPTL